MATLKHIASKNSDYTAIEAYLVYQHDAFTGKQLLDEQGRPKLRESYLLDTLECGNFSFSTFIRRAIHNVKIEKTVIVASGGEETLTAVSTLLAQCSRVGGNLNQLARHFNSGGADTEQIRAKLLDELADLTAFRLSAEKVLGELYGNAQAYRL